jgi:hypothetical protein
VARSVPQIISIAAIFVGLGLFVVTLFYIDIDETFASARRLGLALPLVMLPSAAWTHCPNELSTHLAALALTEFGDSPLQGATHLIMDRDIKPPSGFEKCFKRMASNQSSSLLVLPI